MVNRVERKTITSLAVVYIICMRSAFDNISGNLYII